MLKLRSLIPNSTTTKLSEHKIEPLVKIRFSSLLKTIKYQIDKIGDFLFKYRQEDKLEYLKEIREILFTLKNKYISETIELIDKEIEKHKSIIAS